MKVTKYSRNIMIVMKVHLSKNFTNNNTGGVLWQLQG